jgi:two-component system nitrogen regulation response regulator NtrX
VLRALQEGIITRIGGSKAIQVDVRILAATNKDIEEEIGSGRFREDLFYRLNVVPIHVPPLRERREDIPALVQHFVRELSGGAGVAGKSFDPGAIERLQQRVWPGNVRELRNAIERLLILATGRVVSARDVSRLLGEGATSEVVESVSVPAGTFESFKQDAEKSFLVAKLKEHDWNVAETARALRMPRSNLYKKIERHGITREES